MPDLTYAFIFFVLNWAVGAFNHSAKRGLFNSTSFICCGQEHTRGIIHLLSAFSFFQRGLLLPSKMDQFALLFFAPASFEPTGARLSARMPRASRNEGWNLTPSKSMFAVFHSAPMIMTADVPARQRQKWKFSPAWDWSWSLQLLLMTPALARVKTWSRDGENASPSWEKESHYSLSFHCRCSAVDIMAKERPRH